MPPVSGLARKLLGSWTVRAKLALLLAVPLGGLLLFSIKARRTLDELRVNGPVYKEIINGKDLIADVLPPPAYIVEAHLVVLQALHAPDPKTRAAGQMRLMTLEREFEASLQRWQVALAQPALRAKIETAATAARRFFDLAKTQVFPALMRGEDAAALDIARTAAAAAFEQHRRAIDDVVAMARTQNSIRERHAEMSVTSGLSETLALAAFTMLFTTLAGIGVATSIITPITRLDDAMQSQARGEPWAGLGGDEDNELGRLARSFDRLTQAIATRTTALERSNAELESANRELETFSYSVSHDLRTPVRAILGFSDALVEDFGTELPPEARRFVKVIHDSAARMGQLVDDLLAFSRHSRSPIKRERVATDDVVRSCTETIVHGNKGVDIDFCIEPLPPCVGDRGLLCEVFMNLLCNAVKFSQKKQKAIVKVSGVQQDGQVMYCVQDNGEGFDMRYADKLFKVFSRLHTQEQFEGTGIGLALVERIVVRHGGRVWADAKVGTGATFSFTIPSG